MMVNHAQQTVSKSRQIVENFRIIFLTLGIVFQDPKPSRDGMNPNLTHSTSLSHRFVPTIRYDNFIYARFFHQSIRDKLRPDGPLGSYADFTYITQWLLQKKNAIWIKCNRF